MSKVQTIGAGKWALMLLKYGSENSSPSSQDPHLEDTN